MNTLMLILSLLLAAAMIVAAVMAIMPSRSRAIAILAAGTVSLFASIMFLVLAAPDVAMTEASIGSGLTTMIFLYAIRKTQNNTETKITRPESEDSK